MIDSNETARKLEAPTDQGLFERLATAVLRESDPACQLLTHPGVNVDGKTVKAPVDGIAFVPGAVPPHMIAVHHTTCARDDLEKKWLHDPAKVKPRKTGGRPTAPAGDLIKTIPIFEEQRKKTPALRGTLILTTNQEPADSLVRDVSAAGQAVGLDIKIWARSALAHFLDTDPTGQWIRRQFLGIEQERLSGELLRELSRRSLELNRPPDDGTLWVERVLDKTLAQLPEWDVFIVVAESGQGKSVACYKRLMSHVEAGGYAIILPHGIVAQSLSLDGAIDAALRQLYPTLASSGGSEWQVFISAHMPLLIVVEDINKSGQPAVLIEKLAGWSRLGSDGTPGTPYQMLCPVWPRILAGLGDEVRKRVSALTLSVDPFSANEATAAVQRRYERAGISVTQLEAQTVAEALGDDPLLIALHDPAEAPEPDRVIGRFVDSSLERLAHARDEFTAAEYKRALRNAATAMLENRCLDPAMAQAGTWFSAAPDTMTMLRHITRFGEILHMAGPASDERVAFRHDRVRGWILADAAAELMRREMVPLSVLAEPYLAEVVGDALTRCDAPAATVAQVHAQNPLALFYALRQFGDSESTACGTVHSAAETWLGEAATHGPENSNLRWEASRALAETDSPHVVALARRFKQPPVWWIEQARFRNGDILAGVRMCSRHEPGTGIVGRLELIEYVRKRYARPLVDTLDALLHSKTTTADERIGALRLAGHLADPALADAIATSWQSDPARDVHLAAYLWAGAQCGGDDPARLLDPICDAWAALPDEAQDKHSSAPRSELAAHEIRWAFQKFLPESSIRYFITRANAPDLQWPITYMLHGVDHPDAVEFIAGQLAAIDESLDGSDSFSPFAMTAKDEWRRRQEDLARPMSEDSRTRLLGLWKNGKIDKYLRKAAFRLWAATISTSDVADLADVSELDILANSALRERLRRGDKEAIPLFVAKLQVDDKGTWWHCGRYIWSDELTLVLDAELNQRGAKVERRWNSTDGSGKDWLIYGLLMRLPVSKAEEILLKHWDHLRYAFYYVQTALYVATPPLVEAVAKAIAECPDPKPLFAHLTMHFGYKTVGHPGITRLRQVESLLPYLDYLSDQDIQHLWDLCNERGWWALRRKHIDARLTLSRRDIAYTSTEGALAELDDMLAKQRTHWADHWVDKFLKTGVSVDHVMRLIQTWLARQKDVAALEMAAQVIMHVGHRHHLEILTSGDIKPIDEATAIRANAVFAVMRRSLI